MVDFKLKFRNFFMLEGLCPNALYVFGLNTPSQLQGWHKKPDPKNPAHKTREKPTLKMCKKPGQNGFFEKIT